MSLHTRRYYTESLSERYIISHGILRCILGHYTEQAPEHVEFINNKYGKPYLKNSKIKFNMSHSHNMVCYIVTFNNEVGIDIELWDSNLDVMELSKLVLTPKETILFNSLIFQERHLTFFNLWTKKEALIKASGEGLSYPINTIEALSAVLGDKVILTSIDDYSKREFYGHALEIIPNYSGAIASKIKIDEIVYVNAYNQSSVFDNIRSECLHY